MKRRISLALALASLACACSESKPEHVSSAPTPAQAPKPAAEPAPTAAAARPSIDPATAKAFVESWVSAQNAQDFGAYAAMYATRFTGIKRAGERTARFDRAGWLSDRKGMFARGFRVEVNDVAARALGATAVVTFDQAYRSQNFADRGPKQLVLALQNGEPKIAREELLRSELTRQLSAVTIGDRDFAFVRTLGDRRFWISRATPAGQTIDGAPEFVDRWAAWGRVATERLPAELKALAGSTVLLDPSPEHSCEVRLENFGVLAEFRPHFGDVQRWEGEAPHEALPKETVARELFGDNEVHGPDHAYAVEIALSPGCKSARWARAKELSPVPVYPIAAVAGAELEALRASVRKTAPYLQLQQRFRAERPEGQWDVVTGAEARGYATQVGSNEFALLTLRHNDDCASFSGEMTALGRVQAAAFKHLAADVQGVFVPVLAIDLDNDGMPEWLSETELLGWGGNAYSLVVSVKPSDYDCPC
jgi:ketosteroid isomerase-like protein